MVAPNDQPPLVDLIGALLAEQGRLHTPAARAGFAFDQIENRKSKSENFQSLIPLTAPRPGEQYAFEVNLDKCTGCKACVAACHSLNGLDDTEAWRDVGLITGIKSDGVAYQQTVTRASRCSGVDNRTRSPTSTPKSSANWLPKTASLPLGENAPERRLLLTKMISSKGSGSIPIATIGRLPLPRFANALPVTSAATAVT
jgi:ferredoxin